MNLTRKINDTLVVISFSLIACIIIIQVIARYLLHSPLSWTEEAARYLQVWLVMLGSAIVMRKGSHLAIDILTANLLPKNKRLLKIFIYILIAAFLLTITLYGVKLVVVVNSQSSPAMQIPMSIPYLAFPIGGGLMLVEAIMYLIRMIKQTDINKRGLD